MIIGLHDSDNTGFPNLALMKVSAFYKACGAVVEWYVAGKQYDLVYSSKIFTFTSEDITLPLNTIRGGTGYDLKIKLPDYIDSCFPDYSIYQIDYSLGFLTRGCHRKCNECFVPEKEGNIRAYNDINRFLLHDKVVLMDNNVLAHPHGIQQLEKIANMNVKVDFNQGLDARLIDDGVAKLLSKLKWLSPVRLACDHVNMMPVIHKAVELLRWHNCTPRQYFCYVLMKDLPSTIERVKFLKGIYVDPFVQPYRNQNGDDPPKEFKHFARWVNAKQAFKSTTWDEYRYHT